MSIFERQPVSLAAMRSVAERRFGDAEALVLTGENARANGAQYLCGFVIEILLKAELLRRFPRVMRRLDETASPLELHIAALVWQRHDLKAMLEHLPTTSAAVTKAGSRAGKPYADWLRSVCGTWSVFVRYSPLTSTIDDPQEMLARVRVLKEIIK